MKKGLEKVYIAGCGITGSVIARILAENGAEVRIIERRNHIGGNMYDFVEEHGCLVSLYGPHAFHTNDKDIYDFICRFGKWKPYRLCCGAVWDGRYTPSPFNYETIDAFYPKEEAKRLKKKFDALFPCQHTITVVDALKHEDADVRAFAEFLFRNDYAPYTAKQWGVSPDRIDASVLKRVPVRFSYDRGYFDDEYQVLPETSYASFFEKLLDHENIRIQLGEDALKHITFVSDEIRYDGETCGAVVYTGPIDRLFNYRYGKLSYRSLKFEWKYSEKKSMQEEAIVAYPKEKLYTRITEYTKLPVQNIDGTVYAVEYPVPEGEGSEPYYPVLTKENSRKYEAYRTQAGTVGNLYLCGRLADFKYYNMDQAIKNALKCAEEILARGITNDMQR